MTKIIGLTGGIASGKTTIVNFLKKKKYAIHDSDAVVKKIYSFPKPSFIKYLKNIGLSDSIKKRTINKNIIRNEVFNNKSKKKNLEKFIHKEVGKSRTQFLKYHKKRNTKIVFLDIPLLFECKLEKICDYVILLYAPIKTRKQRAMKRKDMNKKILNKITKTQLSDKIKRTKSDFVISTSGNISRSFKDLLETINLIKKNYNA